MEDSASGCLLVIVVIALLAYFIGLPPYDSSSVYFELCDQESCEDRDLINGAHTFRTSIPGQAVVLMTDVGHVQSLSRCHVFDRKNWRCDEYQMSGGEMPMPYGWSSSEFRYTSKLEWHISRLRSFLRGDKATTQSM